MIDQTIAHFHILEKLGAGGMGVVYRARDTHLNRFVAIKVLQSGATSDAARRQRFIQEARATSALNHPHIVTVHDVYSNDGVDYIVMELVTGRTLGQAIGRKGLKLDAVLRYGSQIADALTAAHKAGIVHRDLKRAPCLYAATVRHRPFRSTSCRTPRMQESRRQRRRGPARYLSGCVATVAR